VAAYMLTGRYSDANVSTRNFEPIILTSVRQDHLASHLDRGRSQICLATSSLTPDISFRKTASYVAPCASYTHPTPTSATSNCAKPKAVSLEYAYGSAFSVVMSDASSSGCLRSRRGSLIAKTKMLTMTNTAMAEMNVTRKLRAYALMTRGIVNTWGYVSGHGWGPGGYMLRMRG
jgi:hypothetical protein